MKEVNRIFEYFMTIPHIHAIILLIPKENYKNQLKIQNIFF